MGRMIPTEIRDPYSMLPTGILQFKVADAFEASVGKEGEEVYGVIVQAVVTAPPSHAGEEHTETFFIGVNESAKAVQDGKLVADPNAERPETWKARAGQFKKFCAHFDLQIEGADMDLVLAELKGKEILGKVIHATSKTLREDGTPFVNARVDRWFKPGEVVPAIDTVQQATVAPGAGPRPAGPAAGPRPAGPAAAAQPAVQPAAAAPARPALRRLGK